jgi:hypothetical protein
MDPRFSLPHIDISRFLTSAPYQGSGTGGGRAEVRDRQEHGRRLARELEAAFDAADALRPTDDRIVPPAGTYLEVELRRGAKPDLLDRKRDGIRTGASHQDENEARTVALFVPDVARAVLPQIIADYTDGPLTEAGKPPHRGTVGAVEAFRRARLETLWTDDPAALPDNPRAEMWWAVWCWEDAEEKILDLAARLELRAGGADRWLRFPEATVIPILATRAAIELMMFSAVGIAELRRGSDTPVFFTEEVRAGQRAWADDLAGRIEWPGNEAPSVCLFDTGVNRAHPLIEPALAEGDLLALDDAWGDDDHYEASGHGTPMAGLALHGDLTAPLGDQEQRALRHRLESVKVLPPRGFDPNDPASYGALTQAAVSLAEYAAPDRSRTFCMAVTNENVSGAIPSSWSAAIDQAACGRMPGDEDAAPRRLFFLSTGNVPAHIEAARLEAESYPVEDPAQAWNAVTVGGLHEPHRHCRRWLRGLAALRAGRRRKPFQPGLG